MPRQSTRRAIRASTALADAELIGGVQLDLFGAVQARLDAETDLRARACFMPDGSPVVWVAPYDCPAARKGQSVPGWRCWLCGQVEVNDYVLGLNHGLCAHYPETLDWQQCTREQQAARRQAGGHR